MSTTLDVGLHDTQTIEEMRLVTELMLAAARAPDGLEQDVIDSTLGLDHGPRTFPAQRRGL